MTRIRIVSDSSSVKQKLIDASKVRPVMQPITDAPAIPAILSAIFILFRGWQKSVWITAAITEPEPAIVHSKTTRKSGFACIALLSGGLPVVVIHPR